MIFKKPTHVFSNDTRSDLFSYLIMKGASDRLIYDFATAYGYFEVNRGELDGATFVKDLIDVHGWDISSSIHDHKYLTYLKGRKGLEWLRYKIEIDWEYAQNMEELNKHPWIAYTRAVLLMLSTPFYLLIKLLKLW